MDSLFVVCLVGCCLSWGRSPEGSKDLKSRVFEETFFAQVSPLLVGPLIMSTSAASPANRRLLQQYVRGALVTVVAVVVGALCACSDWQAVGQSSDDIGWHLARTMDSGDQRIEVHARVRHGGELGFRFTGALDSSIVELLSLARETDLMPTWNIYCSVGNVVRVASPTELWAFADFHFWPMPIPRIFAALHATLDDRLRSNGGTFRVSARSEPEGSRSAFDRSSLPRSVRQHFEVIVTSLEARLRPLDPPNATSARTAFDLQLVMSLTNLAFLGPLRFLNPPQWVVNVIANVMLPGLWKAILETVTRLRVEGTCGAIGARLVADRTGIYRRLRRSSGQSDVSTRKNRAAC